ncbi:MAG: flagellar biosynthetic protein FliO [Firmicutes bacterium]|nr:flagellar biosynthetic protein FliO [Bacillota bacterium]
MRVLIGLSVLFLCIAVLLVLAWLASKNAASGKALPGMTGAGSLKTVARVPVGRNQWVVVLRAGERGLVLGVGTEQISLLTELTPQELAEIEQTPQKDGGFSAVLQGIVKKSS